MQQSKALSEKLENALENALLNAHNSQDAGHDASHDLFHARRVKLNALAIAERDDKADKPVLVAAAYLHDLINVPKNAANRDQASRLSAQAAIPILTSLAFDDAQIADIVHCIEAHSFSANIAPNSLEARILQDADRLESLGALGIARTFYIAGKLDSALFDGHDPFGEERALDDKQFAIDHFKIKLLTLADTMKTEAGRVIAQQRTSRLRRFLDDLADEIGAQHSW